MDLKQMYREIVNEHNLHPTHKHDMENPTMVLRGVNPSCGDDISLKLKVEDGVIKDGSARPRDRKERGRGKASRRDLHEHDQGKGI